MQTNMQTKNKKAIFKLNINIIHARVWNVRII